MDQQKSGEEKAGAPVQYAGVVVEAPLTKVFHYRIPEHLVGKVQPGDRADIPFARRRIRGVVVSLSFVPPIDPSLIKPLNAISPPEERIPEDLLDLTKWVADYYRCGWGMVLAAAVPAAVKQGRQERTIRTVDISLPPAVIMERAEALQKRAPRQARCLTALAEWFGSHPGEILTSDDPVVTAVADAAILRHLAEKELVLLGEPSARQAPAFPEQDRSLTLSLDQQAALETVSGGIESGGYHSYLLHGVTGSGKTEVYIRLIEKTLAAGRGALVLVPEISLTPQTVARFSRRFGDIAVLHSNLGDGERARHWRQLCTGEVRLAVGARSGVFAPVRGLGLIVVDEEHERTYKQDNDPRYHARDVALMRGRQSGAVVVLGSATPSLESWANVERGKHVCLPMPTRPGGAKPPKVEVVDLRQEWAEVKHPTLFSRRLHQALENCLRRKEQAILFLNRRGFHTSVRCASCGEAVECENCDVAMTHHRRASVLRCGCCGYERGVPETCAECGSRTLRFLGTGTERVEDVLADLYPKARLLRMDSDSMTARDSHREGLAAFARHEYDILLGTQMVAKGLDFPEVTLVGVLMADGALGMSDFRAAERTFQLVTQVIGRAGRSGKEGLAVVQALQPEHPAVTCAVAQDYQSFVETEMPDRRQRGYPPFGRLSRLVVSGEDEKAVEQCARHTGQVVKSTLPASCRVLGPGPCEVERLQKVFRWHMLLFAPDHVVMARWLEKAGIRGGTDKGIRLLLDMDAVSML